MEQITILGRSFHLHCEEDQREMLATAGRNVDRMLQQIRRGDSSLTAETAAFLACIQLTYDQLSNQVPDSEEGSRVQLSAIQAKLERLNAVLDRVPNISLTASPTPSASPVAPQKTAPQEVVKAPRLLKTTPAALRPAKVSNAARKNQRKLHQGIEEDEDGIPVVRPSESGALF